MRRTNDGTPRWRGASCVLATCCALAWGCYGPVPGAEADATPAADAAALDTAGEAPLSGDPGRVTLRRLNRSEYDRTVRDLLGVDLRPAEDFPPDDTGYGFDNNADVLSLSPLMLEMYERAADTLVEAALREPLLEEVRLHVEAEGAGEAVGLVNPGVGILMFSAGGRVAQTVEVPRPGAYHFEVRAFAEQAGDETVRMAVRLGPTLVQEVEVAATSDAPAVYTAEVEVGEGPASLVVEFANGQIGTGAAVRSLTVDWMRLRGPVGFEPPPADWTSPRERLLVCDPEEAGEAACAREVVAAFLYRAWRRPVTDAEVDRLVGLYDLARGEGADWEEAVALPLKAALVSPHFLFRVELDEDAASAEPHPLGDFELAARLSYFLWSSMPDADLMQAAAEGRLQDPDELEAQVERMLDDPRSAALLDDFFGQWLLTRGVDEVAPDAWYFPEFDDALRASMRREMELFFRSFMESNRPLPELISADRTWVDARLAEHYGMPAPEGEGFVEVEAAPWHRGGILKQAGLLTVLSYPTRTSPVVRGRWAFENLLCGDVPAPPPGVEGFTDEQTESAKTLRDALEQHRADPDCAVCHVLMDPIGLGLENFDGVGRWRTEDDGWPIDPSGALMGEAPFEGVDELSVLLANTPDLVPCIVEKTLTYALGRGPTAADATYVEAVADDLAARGMGFRDLVKAVVTSEPFRMRRGEPEEGGP